MANYVYDVRGECVLVQNNGWTVRLDLKQNPPGNDWSNSEPLQATATANGPRSGSMHSTNISGRTREDEFTLVINWNTGDVGEYYGRFTSEGRLSGHSFNRRKPADQESWFTERTFRRW